MQGFTWLGVLSAMWWCVGVQVKVCSGKKLPHIQLEQHHVDIDLERNRSPSFRFVGVNTDVSAVWENMPEIPEYPTKKSCRVELELNLTLFDFSPAVHICLFKEEIDKTLFTEDAVINIFGETYGPEDVYEDAQVVTGFVKGNVHSKVQGHVVDAKFYGSVRFFDPFRLHHVVFYVEPRENAQVYDASAVVPAEFNGILFEYIPRLNENDPPKVDDYEDSTETPPVRPVRAPQNPQPAASSGGSAGQAPSPPTSAGSPPPPANAGPSSPPANAAPPAPPANSAPPAPPANAAPPAPPANAAPPAPSSTTAPANSASSATTDTTVAPAASSLNPNPSPSTTTSTPQPTPATTSSTPPPPSTTTDTTSSSPPSTTTDTTSSPPPSTTTDTTPLPGTTDTTTPTTRKKRSIPLNLDSSLAELFGNYDDLSNINFQSESEHRVSHRKIRRQTKDQSHYSFNNLKADDDVVHSFRFQAGITKHNMFDMRRRDTYLCELCIWIQPNFAHQFRLGGRIQHGVAGVINIIEFLDWIFRTQDFDQDGLPENIGFAIKALYVNDLIRVTKTGTHEPHPGRPDNGVNSGTDPNPEYYFSENVQTISPKSALALARKHFQTVFKSCCASIGFIYHNMAPAISATNLRGLCTTKNIALVSGLLHSNKIGKYDVFRALFHAMGHLFGGHHDDITNLRCHETAMYRFLNPFPLHPIQQLNVGMRSNSFRLSRCSKDHITQFLSSNGIHCLIQVNETYCGNGIEEDGEECDCGAPWQCHVSEECCGEADTLAACQITDPYKSQCLRPRLWRRKKRRK